MTTEAFITPKLLRWARERRDLSSEELAKKVGVSADKIDAWEREKGELRPTFRQSRELAQKLHVPFAYLYLSSPPSESLPLPDLRTVADAPPGKPTPDFLETLYGVLRKQQWYREHLRSRDATSVAFVGRFGLDHDPAVVAADIRDTLGLNDGLRREAKSWEQFLTLFVRKAENERVLVLRSGIVGSDTHRILDVAEFRGFAISDDLAPLVFINSRDAKAAQIFTLAHELAHLWIGQSGISNPDYTQRSSQQQNIVDRQCDRIAAEVLVPRDDFDTRWSDSRTLDDNIQRLAARYRVSAFVVLRRAYELDKLATDLYQIKYRDLLRKTKSPRGDKDGNFYATLLSRNSSTFTSALLIATAEGQVPPREAASFLSVHVATLRNIESRLMGVATTNA